MVGVAARALFAMCLTAACGALGVGCGGTGRSPAVSRSTPISQATCPQGPFPPAPTATTPGVYRSGPLTLEVGHDLAQVSVASVESDGVGAYLRVRGNRRVALSVDPGSRGRLGLQFTAMSGDGPGLYAVRFPTCPGGRGLDGSLTFVGGLALHAPGCARLRISVLGQRPASLLLPIGNSLSGCPDAGSGARLSAASLPYLGIACGVANRAGCDRVRIGVHLARPAVLVTVQVDGRLVTLSPPPDPGGDLWQGALLGAGPRHGPLAVHARHGHWYGEPPVYARVRVTAYFTNGTRASLAGIAGLHAGYG